ncbi:MAG TPA: hypothetical protein VIP29_00880 [Nitrososphaeraceae archaeon]
MHYIRVEFVVKVWQGAKLKIVTVKAKMQNRLLSCGIALHSEFFTLKAPLIKNIGCITVRNEVIVPEVEALKRTETDGQN